MAALLLGSVVLFAVGVALENSAGGEEGHSVEGEGEVEGTEAEDAEETLLGIDLESPAAVVTGVVVSLILAVLALRSDKRAALIVIALFTLAFAILDVRELLHQFDEDRSGIAALAGLIAVLHLGASAVAAREARA